MKRPILIVIPLLVIGALTLSLALLDRYQTPAWRMKLNRYLTYLRTASQASHDTLAYAPASQPENFTPEMSAESFSDSVIFETTFNLTTEYSTELLPMPYPPKEVVCILLADGNPPQLVYVTLHDSLYNADWIVNISTDRWGSRELDTSLVSLGCSLDL